MRLSSFTYLTYLTNHKLHLFLLHRHCFSRRRNRRGLRLLRPLRLVFTFANPAFDAELAVNGEGFRKAIIDIRAQRVQRNPAPMILLHAGELSATQTAGATDLDAFRAEILRGLQSLLHRAS